MAKRTVRRRPPEAQEYLDKDTDNVETEEEAEEEVAPRRRARAKKPVETDTEADWLADDEDTAEAAAEDEEEDEAPRRPARPAKKAAKKVATKRTRVVDEDDEDDDEDEDEDDEEETEQLQLPMKGGWEHFNKLRKENSNFPEEFKPTDDEQLVKFLDDVPFTSYKLHWFQEIRQGQKGFMCIGENCPACEAGDSNPALKALFNVVLFEPDGSAEVKVLVAGSRLGATLEAVATSKKGPLTKHYYGISKSGPKKNPTYVVSDYRERDLEKEWEIEPLSREEIKQFSKQKFGPEYYEKKAPSRKELRAVVRDVAGED